MNTPTPENTTSTNLMNAYAAHDRLMTLPTEEHAEVWDRMLRDIEAGEELAAMTRPDLFDGD